MQDYFLWLLQVPDEISQSSWLVRRQADKLRLEWASGHDKPKIVELLAAIEAAFIYYPSLGKLDLTAPVDQTAYLLRRGLALQDATGHLVDDIELFWQHQRMWLALPESGVIPLTYRFSAGRRHPLRPPQARRHGLSPPYPLA